MTRVLRLGPGDALIVFNGRGGEYAATVAHASRGGVKGDVGAHRPVDLEPVPGVELAQEICKGQPDGSRRPEGDRA